MSLLLALGSNLGTPLDNLSQAVTLLQQEFELIKTSRIYKSEPVEYTNQPIFFNQVIEFKRPTIRPEKVLAITQSIEQKCGGHLAINKGPRYMDIDILFYGNTIVDLDNLKIPHPAIAFRSFVLLPLSELPFYQSISHQFPIPNHFSSWAFPIDPNA